MAATPRSPWRLPPYFGAVWVGWVVAMELLMISTDGPTPIRVVLSVLFVFTVPGFLVLDLMRPAGNLAKVMVGIGASLSTHLVLASVWLVPDPVWIGSALLVAYVGFRVAPGFESIVASARHRRATPANVWVPLPSPNEPDEPRDEPSSVSPEAAIVEEPPSSSPEAAIVEEPTSVSPEPAIDAEPEPVTGADSSAPAEDRLAELPDIGDVMAREDPVVRPARSSGPPRDAGGAFVADSTPDPVIEPGVEPGESAERPAVDDADSDEAPATAPAPGRSGIEAAAPPLDLNRATVTELAALPGIGERLAERIVEHREVTGPFPSVAALVDVPGIGEKRLEAIASEIVVHPRSHTDWQGRRSAPHDV